MTKGISEGFYVYSPAGVDDAGTTTTPESPDFPLLSGNAQLTDAAGKLTARAPRERSGEGRRSGGCGHPYRMRLGTKDNKRGKRDPYHRRADRENRAYDKEGPDAAKVRDPGLSHHEKEDINFNTAYAGADERYTGGYPESSPVLNGNRYPENRDDYAGNNGRGRTRSNLYPYQRARRRNTQKNQSSGFEGYNGNSGNSGFRAHPGNNYPGNNETYRARSDSSDYLPRDADRERSGDKGIDTKISYKKKRRYPFFGSRDSQ